VPDAVGIDRGDGASTHGPIDQRNPQRLSVFERAFGRSTKDVENDLARANGPAAGNGNRSRWVAAFEPRYVLEIARLLTRTGQTDAARKEYRRFLGFWKNADPGLPEIAEARRGM
jgi:hypothetical protein